MLNEQLNSGRYRLRPHELRGYNGMLLPLLLPGQKKIVPRELYDELPKLLDKEDDGRTKSLWKKELR